jgi:hypothetical protein
MVSPAQKHCEYNEYTSENSCLLASNNTKINKQVLKQYSIEKCKVHVVNELNYGPHWSQKIYLTWSSNNILLIFSETLNAKGA